ncbi:hypothetical protein SAMN04488001_3177 [Litoreibacter albidus]|uniref:Uncharacterized protein n=2 Tax=Litoreibacter albidus TaxID=670155 RepID=A0A1H3BML1_9RHOB|nr:hypothetical protein SAMN04488001_3177 [Litoreibacter albidus]
MLMDKMTEMVAHMIGIFHTGIEEARMRDAYDKFKALQAADPDSDPLAAPGLTFQAKYTLDGYTPNLRYSEGPPIGPASEVSSPFFADLTGLSAALPFINEAPANSLSIYMQITGGGGRPQLILDPPASVAVITSQAAYLSDNDILMLGNGDTIFTDPAEFWEQIAQLQTVAAAIGAPLDADRLIPGKTATEDAIALHTLAGAATVSTLSGVTAHMMHGVDAIGTHVNGDDTDELPTLTDLWPAIKTEDDDVPDDEADGHDWPDPFDGLSPAMGDDTIPEIDDGHAVVAGANSLINEVAISSAWLDAPVISVMGDVVKLSVVAQINVLMDIDYGTFADAGTSTVMNAVTHTITATTPPLDAEGDAAPPPTGLPSNWAVTRIEGDLISVNQISQYSFVTDNDRAEITFSSANTYIGLGDNTVVNLTDFAELGFGYDLIMIGGSMISVDWISQVNVMVDNDTVTYSGDVAGDFSGSDNLLFNGAIINAVGVDSYGEMQDNFASASDSLADGAQSIGTGVAHDSVFEGVEILRVLYIEGDLTTINWIEQTNILGDSDQVHLALDSFEAATGTSATVTAGSNSTVNIASINTYGVDSEVSVNGDVYDDALLYQAELIDTNADPLGVDMPALASEAVAFLADDMMTPDMGPADAPITATASESTASSDVMQSMLA